MSAPALIGLAHGSRHPDTPASLARLVQAVVALAADQQMPIEGRAAFLDLTEPDLVAVAAQLHELGHDEAVAVPLLFTRAFHATVDVPQAAREAIEGSGLSLQVAPIIGTGEDVVDVLAAIAEEFAIDPGSEVILYAVGSSDEPANDAVRDLAAKLATRRGTRVRATFGTRPPRGMEVLDSITGPVAVLPLFTAPGLLLDPMLAAAARRGVVITPPLEARLAPLVLARYRQAASHRDRATTVNR